MSWDIALSKDANNQMKKITSKAIRVKIDTLLAVIRINPFQNPPPYEKLSGNLHGYYSRRINIQHRLIYQVFKKEYTVKVLSMWTHYE